MYKALTTSQRYIYLYTLLGIQFMALFCPQLDSAFNKPTLSFSPPLSLEGWDTAIQEAPQVSWIALMVEVLQLPAPDFGTAYHHISDMQTYHAVGSGSH